MIAATDKERFGKTITKQLISAPKGKTTKQNGINIIDTSTIFPDIVPDDQFIFGENILPNTADFAMDMVTGGTSNKSREHIAEHNKKVMNRARILTVAKKAGFDIPTRTSSMVSFGKLFGASGGGKAQLVAPVVENVNIDIPIIIPPTERYSPEVSHWTDAQIYAYISNRGQGGYVDYLSQGGTEVPRLSRAYARYMDHNSAGDFITDERKQSQPPSNANDGFSIPTNTPTTGGDSAPKPPVSQPPSNVNDGRSWWTNTPTAGGESKVPQDTIPTDTRASSIDEVLPPLKPKPPESKPPESQILKRIGMPDHWKRIVKSTGTNVDYKTVGKQWLSKYFKDNGRPVTLPDVDNMIKLFKKQLLTNDEAKHETNSYSDEKNETKTETAHTVVNTAIDIERGKDDRATDDPNDTGFKKPGLVKTFPTKLETKTRPGEPPFPPPPPRGIIEKPIDPEPEPEPDEKEKKKKRPDPPWPRIPDEKEPEPEPKIEPKPAPDETVPSVPTKPSTRTGYLRPYFMVGGQDILALTRKEELQEIKDWDLLDLPIPENESYDNPLYRQHKRIESSRFGYVYRYPQVRQKLLVERPNPPQWTNQSIRRSQAMARPMLSYPQHTTMYDPYDNPTNRTVVDRDRRDENGLADYARRYALIYPDIIPDVNTAPDSVRYAKPKINYVDIRLATS